MHPDDLDDTHLCIKCNATIIGLTEYIEHRKQRCVIAEKGTSEAPGGTSQPVTTSSTNQVSPPIISRINLDHTYDGFHFAEPEAPSSYLRKTAASHGGKTSKSLSEAYGLPYDLGADVFFSSLQLQSVSTGGKTRQERPKDDAWPPPRTDPLMKAVREHEDAVFKPLKFHHDSPEASEEEDEDEDPDDFDHEPEEDDEEYDVRRSVHSPPAVPAGHTGGKWKPEHRPQLRHAHIERISPTWEEPGEEAFAQAHPPEDHTKGKWVPGSKQLEYRENIDLTKLGQPGGSTCWCNICCRRFKSRSNYEQHLRSSYHMKKADAERQLEQATLATKDLTLSKEFAVAKEVKETEQPAVPKKRRRRANLLRCDLCRHTMARQLMGKHLISHFHYRRLQQQPDPLKRQASLQDILIHMGSIVRQSPFQCLPCRFYANTEETFLDHWRARSHVSLTKKLGGNFWCGYCQFECGSNEDMWLHLLDTSHKEVLMVLNRSVPICIAQRRMLECSACDMSFLFNFQLRRHFAAEHPGQAATGTAADDYQCRFRCGLCGNPQKSRMALQRHEKHKHHLARYYCAICRLQFHTPLEARRHRSLMQHKLKARPKKAPASPHPDKEIEHILRQVLDETPDSQGPAKKKKIVRKKCANCEEIFDSVETLSQHRNEMHPTDNHECLSCGLSFQSAQALGRHTRSCKPLASTSSASSKKESSLHSCDQCQFRSKFESDLIYHRLFHDRTGTIGKDEVLQCPLCPKNFKKHSLRAHLRNHTDERIFKCAECNQKFARRHNLKNHVAAVHGKKEDQEATKLANKKKADAKDKPKYECKTCGKILVKKYSLKLHELSHTNSLKRTFSCDVPDCSYAGLTPESLKTHLASHSKGSHKCDREKCTYVGKSELHLRRHLKSAHTADEEGGTDGREWFSCDQCEFRARTKTHLRRHSLRHSGQKPHQCPHCSFQCSTIDNLRKHIVRTGKHPGKFVYECEECKTPNPDRDSPAIFKSNSFKEYQKHLAEHAKD
ncbi:hypothetical protein KR018_012640 [Drosophila ironensis]|nr:hypothetical protein KR018_012640 [Drosophila ironensis]